MRSFDVFIHLYEPIVGQTFDLPVLLEALMRMWRNCNDADFLSLKYSTYKITIVAYESQVTLQRN